MGAGAWGTTLARLAQRGGHQVQVWSRSGDQDLGSLIAKAEVLISAVAMAGVGHTITQLQACGRLPPKILVTATKGLARGPRIVTPAQLWQAAFPTHSVVVLSGPNLCREIDQGRPAATVVASGDAAAAVTIQGVLASPQFRVYTSPDPLGVELGGTLKNVIAIAAGASDGLELGANAKAALVTRGLAEMIRVGTYWGAKTETFYGLSGLGDLLATCNSPLSRNYQLGYQLAQGSSLKTALEKLSTTVEGVNTSQVVTDLTPNPEQIMPISYQVACLLRGEITPQVAVTNLMQRDVKSEW